MLIRQGEVGQGLAILDEAMVPVLADELSPDWAGNIYCNMMIACHELADHRRAAQWTDATERWLDTLPVAVLFRGICRVHRSHPRIDRPTATARPNSAAEGSNCLQEFLSKPARSLRHDPPQHAAGRGERGVGRRHWRHRRQAWRW